MSADDGLIALKDNTQSLLKVYYSGLNGNTYETPDLVRGCMDVNHLGYSEMDLHPAKIIVYNKSLTVDIIYLEVTSLAVSKFILEKIDTKLTLKFTQYDIMDKKVSEYAGPYYLLKAMPTSYTLFDKKGNRQSTRPISGWLVTWTLAISPYLPSK